MTEQRSDPPVKINFHDDSVLNYGDYFNSNKNQYQGDDYESQHTAHAVSAHSTPTVRVQDFEHSSQSIHYDDDSNYNEPHSSIAPLRANVDDTNNNLLNTNRLLSDLERKISFGSATSHNTQQSHSSSVIVNKNMNGIAKQSVSSVLQYIKSEEDSHPLNTNEIFSDRQAKFVTSFTKHYVDDRERTQKEVSQNQQSSNPTQKTQLNTPAAQPSYSPKKFIGRKNSLQLSSNRSIHVYDHSESSDAQSPLEEEEEEEEDITLTKTPSPVKVDPDTPNVSRDTSISKTPIETIDVDDPESFDDGYYVEHDAQENENEPSDEEEYSDDELLLPPSPPRSPPQDLDPDKLYGLYDFSGPDPSHCSLFRDEPVYLINDQDNYWWLIKKMNREERVSHHRRIRRKKSVRQNGIVFGHTESDSDQEQENSDASDEEDGKIGFVPAECLETYGERLARLNCFKNEELERNSKDTIDVIEVHSQSYEYGIDLTNPISYQTGSDSNSILSRGNSLQHKNLSHSNSLLQKNLSQSNSLLRRKKSNKSVTFEDLAELELDEDDSQVTKADQIREQKKKDFDNTSFDVHTGEIEVTDEERQSEVLSDVYPAAVPLVINKNGKKVKGEMGSSEKLSMGSHGETMFNPYHQKHQEMKEELDPYHVESFSERDQDKSTNNDQAELSDSPIKEVTSVRKNSLTSKEFLESPKFAPPNETSIYDFAKPTSMANSPFDTTSIGSYSPDTPPKLTKKIEIESGTGEDGQAMDDDEAKEISRNLSQLRRSVILDRLTKVTSDIQEQMGEQFPDTSSIPEYQEQYNREYAKEHKKQQSDKLQHDKEQEKNKKVQQVREQLQNARVQEEREFEQAQSKHQQIQEQQDQQNQTQLKLDQVQEHLKKVQIQEQMSRKTHDEDQSKHDKSQDSIKQVDNVVLEHHKQYESSERVDTSQTQEHHIEDVNRELATQFNDSKHMKLKQNQEPLKVSPKLDQRDIHQKKQEFEQMSLEMADHSSPQRNDILPDILSSHEFPDEDDYEYDDNPMAGSEDGDITPLTSMNSLSNGISISTPSWSMSNADILDKRKSKPVHEMFMPILGKFDELAEKLAELDGML